VVEAGPVDWRFAAYQGEWQAGARIYRDWHNAKTPPAPLTGGRAWVNNIHPVIQVDGGHPYQKWRSQNCDVGYPDYTWDRSFIAHAQELGFYVMPHTNSTGVSPASPYFAAMRHYIPTTAVRPFCGC
jgi:hypothetical protein